MDKLEKVCITKYKEEYVLRIFRFGEEDFTMDSILIQNEAHGRLISEIFNITKGLTLRFLSNFNIPQLLKYRVRLDG